MKKLTPPLLAMLLVTFSMSASASPWKAYASQSGDSVIMVDFGSLRPFVNSHNFEVIERITTYQASAPDFDQLAVTGLARATALIDCSTRSHTYMASLSYNPGSGRLVSATVIDSAQPASSASASSATEVSPPTSLAGAIVHDVCLLADPPRSADP